MRIDWTPLRKALRERCAPPPRFWWRDDDAVAPTSALDRLEEIAVEAGVPVHIAVIPAHAHRALADHVAERTALVPLVHGWAHVDTSRPGQKKSEFQSDHPDAGAQTAQALQIMNNLFGPRLLPIFVPPWNRVSSDVVARLAAQGYRGLSTFGARTSETEAGLRIINTHVDPIYWRRDRGLADPEYLIATAAAHIRSDGTEPLGLLTHHLVHTDAVWDFTTTLIRELQDGGAQAFDVEDYMT